MQKLISTRLESSNIQFKCISLKSKSALDAIYRTDVTAVVAEEKHQHFHPGAWLDLLNNLGRRIPVIILSKDEKNSYRDHFHRADRVSWLVKPTHSDLYNLLISSGVASVSGKPKNKELVPILNEQIPIDMLKTIGSLSMLTIDASKFRSIAMKYLPIYSLLDY